MLSGAGIAFGECFRRGDRFFDHMGTPIQPGLSDEKASRMLVALREGRTLRKFGMSRNCPRFEAYCEAHSDYAGQVLPARGEPQGGEPSDPFLRHDYSF